MWLPFGKRGVNGKGEILPIGDMIHKELSDNYLVHNEVLNFKNYGSNSSRTRTLVIGVDKKYAEDISPIELMLDYIQEKKPI